MTRYEPESSCLGELLFFVLFIVVVVGSALIVTIAVHRDEILP